MNETSRTRPPVPAPGQDSMDGLGEAACYARLSDAKRGRESSIPDQLRSCRDQAHRDGNFIPDSNLFDDLDVRGAIEDRPGLNRLLNLVRIGKATFKHLYVSDTSRLARSSSFAPKLRKFFDAYGITLHFVENGMKSGTSGFDLQHTIQAWADERYSQDLGEKVSRGQAGQLERGYHPCGKCYGYSHDAEDHPTKIGRWGRKDVLGVKQVPVPEQVSVILDIFTMYANGEEGGYSGIARKLRERGIDPPRKGAKNEGSGWSDSTVARILNNERYIGRVVYGRKKKVRDPDTLRVKQEPRDESEWTRRYDPSLQIVPDELWERVKARQAFIGEKVGPKAGGLMRTARSLAYPFGGLLHCGKCGSPMTLTNDRYKCRSALRKWGCQNHQAISRESLEVQFMEALASTIRSETHLADIKSLFRAQLADELKQQKALGDSAASQKQALIEEKHQLEKSLRFLAEEVANFGGDDEVRKLQHEKRTRLKIVKERLDRAERPATTISEVEIDAFLRDAFEKLADVLLGDPSRAKQELMKRVTALTLTPVENGVEPAFGVSGDLTLFTPEEMLQLTPSCTRRGELQPVTFKLDDMVLVLDKRGKIMCMSRPEVTGVQEASKDQCGEEIESPVAA